jgi:hypothetical protein
MSDRRHPGPHPDADQLSAFTEGVLAEPERYETLAHLADCSECRSIVFLAQQAVPTSAAQHETIPTWRRWLPPLSLATAGVACGLIAVFWLRPRSTSAPASHEVAVARQAAPLPPFSSAAPEATPQRPAPRAARTDLAAKKRVPGAPLRQPPSPVPSGAINGFTAGAATQSGQPAAQQSAPVVASDQSQAAPAGRGAPANSAPASSAGSAAVAQNSQRTLAAMRAGSTPKQATSAPLPAAPGALTAGSAANGFLASGNALHITIEHNQGPDNGLSVIRGAVTDPSGAVVGRALVTLRRASGETAFSTATGSDGRFTLHDVAPGQYELQISAQGFQADSQRLDLQARDLAQLSSTLQVGASTQTVAVNAESAALDTTAAMTDTQLAAITPVLPGKLPPTATVVKNGRMLALDAAGTLYLSRDAGRRWTKIHRVWTGSIVHLAPSEQAGSSSLTKREISDSAPPLFELTTTDGAIWISSDGAHWRLR